VLRKRKLVALVLCTFILCLFIAPAVFADQITVKNGDRLTGKIVKSDGKTLVLHTEFAGDVTVDFKAITQISSEKVLRVNTSDKKTLVGPVTTSDGKGSRLLTRLSTVYCTAYPAQNAIPINTGTAAHNGI